MDQDRRIPIISWIEPGTTSATRMQSASDTSKKGQAFRPPAIPRAGELITDVGVSQLRAGVTEAADALREVFEDSFARSFGQYDLAEVEVSLQISADGKVGFMGTGVGVKGSSTIKLKFKRRKTSANASQAE